MHGALLQHSSAIRPRQRTLENSPALQCWEPEELWSESAPADDWA